MVEEPNGAASPAPTPPIDGQPQQPKGCKASAIIALLLFVALLGTLMFAGRGSYTPPPQAAPPRSAPLFYLSALPGNDSGSRLYRQCTVPLYLYNDFARTIDSITIDVSFHAADDRSIGTDTLHWRYIDSQQDARSEARLNTDCTVLHHIRFRRVIFCTIAGQLYRDCSDYVGFDERRNCELPTSR